LCCVVRTGTVPHTPATASVVVHVYIGDITDGTANTLLFGESYHRDPNFDPFTTATPPKNGWNSGSSIKGWSRWYPAGSDNGLSDILGGAFAPINYQTPFRFGDPAAPTAQSAWFAFQDHRRSPVGTGHTPGANVVFADGSVRFLSNQTPQSTLALYCMRNDGLVIPE